MADVMSFAEPTAGTIRLAIDVPDAELASILSDLETDHLKAQKEIDRWLWGQMPGLMSHEWSHMLQVSTYPLLFLRAARQGRLTSQFLSAIGDLPAGTGCPSSASSRPRAIVGVGRGGQGSVHVRTGRHSDSRHLHL